MVDYKEIYGLSLLRIPMDSVDYTKQLNRKSELFKRDLNDIKRSHKKALEDNKETSDSRISSQAESYKKAKIDTERAQEAIVKNLRADQAKTLSDKNKIYEQTVLNQQDDFNKERVDNLKNWNRRVANLKDSFQTESEKKEGREEKIAQNAKENVFLAKDKFEKDFSKYKAQMQENASEFRDSYNKERRDIQARHESEKKDLLDGVVKKQDQFRDYTNEEIRKSRQNQEDHFLAQKKAGEDRFAKFSQRVNEQQKEFSQNEVERLRAASVKGIQDKNKLFAEKYSELEQGYNKDVRDIKRRVEADKVTSGDTRKEYDKQLRETERLQHEQRRETLMNQNIANTKFYNDKMAEMREDQQDELHRERIRASDRISKEKEQATLALQESDFKAKVTQDKSSHSASVRLNQEKSKNSLDHANITRQKKEEISNLKENFKRGIELSEVKTQQSINEIKQEGIMEKRVLEKRLQAENADNTTELKSLMNEKFEKVTGDLESKILSLQNQNSSIQQSANETVHDIRVKSQADLEQQIASSERKLSDLLNAEKDNSRVKEAALRKTLRENQATFNKKMNDITHSNQVKTKKLRHELTTAAKNDAAKYQSEMQINKRYFSRELEKFKIASAEEREGLIAQYESRIKEMQKAYVGKINELKDFNNLEKA